MSSNNVDSTIDEEITLLLRDDKSLKCSKSALTAASPVLKMALQDCEHDGTLRLSRSSLEVWKLIMIISLIDPKQSSSESHTDIKDASYTFLVKTLNSFQAPISFIVCSRLR